ncbi:unnamed protein product [Adineta steineri]|uniref:Tudor domain-containing protein n=1 Tax=Adineta steineri TaxID=433720 RepID=A0A815F7C3_9BILA|nr:unnamed protein product [Adineta steineri]CAF1586776.1 unnamed protein product [Adineta steineri]
MLHVASVNIKIKEINDNFYLKRFVDLLGKMAGDVKKEMYFLDQDRPTVTTYDEKTRKFITSKTVNIHEQLSANKLFSPVLIQSASSCASSIEQTTHTSNYHQNQLNSIDDDDISEELRSLTEQLLPDLCTLDGEQFRLTNGTKFYCTIKDILTSEGEFWVERELSIENERKFRQFIDILSLIAVSYESLKQVYVGQLVALYYETSWHRALVVSKSEGPTISTPPSARVRLVDYGASLYVNVSQLKWLPEQFYLFPFKAVECVFSEAIKPTFSDTIRLTFKQLVLNKRLYATIYDRDGTRICILLKCKTDEGTINVYRYLRAHEHKSKHGRMLADGEIIACLRNTILNNNSYLDQSAISNKTYSGTLPILTPPSSIKLTQNQLQIRRAEINEICKKSYNENQIEAMNGIKIDKKSYLSSAQSTPFSSSTVITPMPRLTFDL